MIEKVSFNGLKGAASAENKKNLTMLSDKLGSSFVGSMANSFSEIDKISGGKDVFVRTEDAENHVTIAIVDNEGDKIAKTSVYYKDYPDDTYCPLESMDNLSVAFVDGFNKTCKPECNDVNCTLDKIFNAYA